MSTVAAAEAIDAITTLFGFGLDVFGLLPKSDTASNKVRIYTGQQQKEDQVSGVDLGKSTGGTRPFVSIWDNLGGALGADRNAGDIPAGSFSDYSFDSPDGRAAEYVSVSAQGEDGICIAAIVMTGAGDQAYTWLGNVGKQCGAPWYYSSVTVGNGKSTPQCVWIDTNADKGHKYNGLSIHMRSFLDSVLSEDELKARDKQWHDRPELMCKSTPRFTMWDQISVDNAISIMDHSLELTGGVDTDTDIDTILNSQNWVNSDISTLGDPQPGKGSTPPQNKCFNKPVEDCLPSGPSALENLSEQAPTRRRKARTAEKRDVRIMPDDLIVSKITTHSARELCMDDMSEGPDLVSLEENLFCDMSTSTNRKQIYPLCSSAQVNGCFDMATYTLRHAANNTSTTLGYNSTIQTSNFAAGSIPQKAYKRIQNWG